MIHKKNMSKGWWIAGCVAVGTLILLLVGVVTMYLWNWLVPELFNGPVITFWQTIGLLILSKIILHGLGRGYHKHHAGPGGDHWKGKMYEKFSSMSPEEREDFKKKMKEKWCRWDQNSSESKTDGSDL